jgi:hypothetical protein
MISIKQVISQIEAFATAHYQVKKFGFEFFEQMPNLATVDEKFPYMFVTPVGATTYENMVEFDLDVYCVDRLQKDRTNMKFTISDTQLILSDLSIWLEDGDHDIDVERIYPQTPINNALLDYVDGWVMKIKVQVDRVELCEVPMDGITPPDFSCEDATYSITDTDGNVLYSGSISSGGSLDQSIQDSTVSITDDSGNVLHSVSVLAEGSASQTIADSTAVLKTTSNVTLSTTSINAEASADITAPDTSIEVNGVSEGSVVAGSTVDVQLSDSLGVVTPTSVTQVGNDLLIVLSDAPAAVTRSTATVPMTGQTTVYRTGDDGDIEAGRATDFFTLDAAPLHNDGTATINTTTARFTDTLGGSTYANDIVLDWSTWNGSTLLGYDIRINGGGADVDVFWNASIDSALAHSVGTFSSGWRLPNRKEIENILNTADVTALQYSPFATLTTGLCILSSSSKAPAATSCYACIILTNTVGIVNKTTANSPRWMACRTFSLSTLNVLS